MDWKSYYEAERQAAGAREAIAAWLALDERIAAAITRRDVLSFPHTALRYAGPLQARVARALFDDSTVERVLALGVLHASGLDAYRMALDERATPAARGAGFEVVRGAFFSAGRALETAFGRVPQWDASARSDEVRSDQAMLRAEFSLDTFAGVLRVAADAVGRPPLPVLPIFIGMTRDPVSGAFAVAEAVADWMRSCVDSRTAVVATGDLVHYGTAYGGAWIDGNPLSGETIAGVLRPEVERTLRAAFVARDWDGAYRQSREILGNDQREMLAVLSSYLGPGASAAILTFDLSDYSSILGVESPCFVASALAAYRRRA